MKMGEIRAQFRMESRSSGSVLPEQADLCIAAILPRHELHFRLVRIGAAFPFLDLR